MAFNQEDFNEHSTRLRLIVMSKMNKPLLLRFNDLDDREKKKFNKMLNQYIQSLPPFKEEWMDKLVDDFNELCLDNIFNEKFDPAKCSCPDVNIEPKLVLKEEEESQ